jgi:enoyl-CoA hydratase/carnithine racemase
MPSAQIAREAAAPPLVLREEHEGICVLSLNRPQVRNALSQDMLSALSAELASVAERTDVRAVVLAAEGTTFCAGHDLKELSLRRSDPDGGRAYFERIWEMCGALMQSLPRLHQPVIAAVQGAATAAGCELVANCDLAVASSSATFCTPGVHIGLFCSTPMIPISRNLARKHALEMLLTGDTLSADDACRVGLVNRVVPAGTERARAIELAHQIAAKSAATVGTGKQAFYRQIDMTPAEAYRYAAGVMVDNMLEYDAIEGIDAFLKKRAPRWKDR